ncbi:hypothetical protein F5Y16DRAFT_395631 [Xylariaceae sp. FL0255]|nr:hypothetical protein F5Y16DRAFT_395631 [Xylariaceae sp. FL0255]
MMATSTIDPLGIVSRAYAETLVSIGKHFQAARSDGPAAMADAHATIHARTEESLKQHHFALNDIEGEIIRAKEVYLRDLEKLRAARAPAPATAPVSAPNKQTVAPAAPATMMELPSTASHTLNPPGPYNPNIETKTVAPFPDMGMGIGLSSDVVDLTVGAKNPSQSSPRVQPGSIKPGARSTPPVKSETKPSPKPNPKPTPPARVTPIPPPQLPRLPTPAQTPGTIASSQSKSQSTAQTPKAAQQAQLSQSASAGKAFPESHMSNTAGTLPANTLNNNTLGSNNSELNFTDMEFSLAPSSSEPTGAPPAPMPEFDLAAFVPPGSANEVTSSTTLDPNTKSINNDNLNTDTDTANASIKNMDDVFNLGNGGSDSVFDLEGDEVNGSAFDDMMYFGGNNDSDMAQFDDAYFGL